MDPSHRRRLTAGLTLSALTGIWHFFIPFQFGWHEELVGVARAVTVSVDWLNLFFSLVLTGISLLLLRHRHGLEHSRIGREFLGLLVLTWTVRVLITIVHPWAYDGMFVAQMAGFSLVWVLLLLPWLRLRRAASDAAH